MVPLSDESLKIDVPNANRCNYLRKTISKSEALELIKKIQTLLLLIKMINHLNTSIKHNHYFEQAEKYLYNELSIALNLNYDGTKEYIIKEVEKLC